MDNQADVPFRSSSSHRLATVSASQALQNLKARGPRSIPTGLKQIDKLLSRDGIGGLRSMSERGGLVRGQVTEIYGPPGVGKTTFGIQACANALQAGNRAVWIDAASPLVGKRFDDIMNAAGAVAPGEKGASSPPGASEGDWKSRFHRYTTPTLPHLLALCAFPPPSFPPGNTAIIVIDSISTLVDNAYPRHTEERQGSAKADTARWAASRKYAVLGELISKLGKLAALHDLVILLTCQTVTRFRPGGGAILVPAISGTEWDNGISTRLVLFRDWASTQLQEKTTAEQEKLNQLRFVGIEKAGGTGNTDDDRVGIVIPFTIEATGLADISLSTEEVPLHLTSPVRPRKRGYAEIADSEAEEPDSDDLYGWAEEDELAAEGLVTDENALATEQSARSVS